MHLCIHCSKPKTSLIRITEAAGEDETLPATAMEVLYEDIRDESLLPQNTAIYETAPEVPAAVTDLNHPYEYVKPAARDNAESAEKYQFTLCSAYGLPVETRKKD
jgi:hypothetical protein